MSSSLSKDKRRADLLREFGSSLIHEAAGKTGAVGWEIMPLSPEMIASGKCRTVIVGPGDNLGAHQAIECALPGEILCVSGASSHFGIWGEIATRSALERQLGGLVTSSGVRDVDAICKLGFPTFVGGVAVQGTTKEIPGQFDIPIRLGAWIVRTGDWIVCDQDGCVVVDDNDVDVVLAAAKFKRADEARIISSITDGMSSRQALKLSPSSATT